MSDQKEFRKDIILVGVDELLPYAKNSKNHSPEQVSLIANSIERFGWTNPCLIADGGLIAGHGRLMAAKKLGIKKVPCIDLSDLSADDRRAYVIMDNRSAEKGATWDLDILREELDALSAVGYDLDFTGFSSDDYNEMFPSEIEASPENDPEDIPEAPAVPFSVEGDVWICGPHRIACGDALAMQTWDKLMQGEMADLCITDPPYNVAYESKLAGSIKNDNMKDSAFRQFLLDAHIAMFAVMKPGAPIYVAHSDTDGLNFRSTFRDAGFKLSGCLIWRKNALVLDRSDYQWQHEPILYGWKPGAAHRWYGGRKLTTIVDYGESGPVQKLEDGRWAIRVGDSTLIVSGDAMLEEVPSSVIYHEKPSRSELHPTTKPVGLWERLMRSSARPGDIVIDSFSGSGTTLIAADRMGMIARVVELDPKFVDVAVRRWEQYTGRTAVHAVTGAPFPKEGEYRSVAETATDPLDYLDDGEVF